MDGWRDGRKERCEDGWMERLMGAWGMKGKRDGRMDGSEGQPVYLGFPDSKREKPSSLYQSLKCRLTFKRYWCHLCLSLSGKQSSGLHFPA